MSTSQFPCFISNTKICQASNPKNSVFIISSSSKEFKEDISTIKEVLKGFNLKGYFANLSKKEIGTDVFCNKICLKIRESRFCVVLLNNPVLKGQDRHTRNISELIRTPSANVYFEFGMAMALEKPVIPIIRKGLDLPFDVQNLDTIIYSDLPNLTKQLKDAVLPCLLKKSKIVRTKNSKLVEKIYEPLSSILDKHVKELETFSYISVNEINDILEKETYYKKQMPQNLLKRLNNYVDQVEALNKIDHFAKAVMDDILNRIILKFLKKPYSSSDSFLQIELKAIAKTGNKLTLHRQDIFLILLENQEIKNFLEKNYWHNTYEHISIESKYSKEDPIELELTEFNKKIWNKCLAEVSANAKVLQFKKNTKSVLEKARAIIDEIVKN